MQGLVKYLRIVMRGSMGGGTVPVLLVVAVIAACGFVYSKGAQRAHEACHAADLEAMIAAQKATIARIQEQLIAAREARDMARARAKRDAAILEQEREEADAFRQDVAARAHRCPVSADDAERLRRIGQ